MFVSTIIPTIGRETLSRAVESVLCQAFTAEFEVIVVNDSGRPLPPATWQESPQVRIITTHRRERCVARNTGAACAYGSYLHFLDDDDWLLPGAFSALHQSALSHPLAKWIYGGAQLVDRQQSPLIELHPQLHGNAFVQTIAGEWIPLQSSIIQSEIFFTIGGFSPTLHGSEDMDLARRYTLLEDVTGIETLVAAVGMGEEDSATNRSLAAYWGRFARERILEQPRAFARMRASAPTLYWHARMTRVYATSAFWNLQQLRFFSAVSRMGLVFACLGWNWRFLWRPAFWQSLVGSHQSFAFARGFQESTN